MKLINVKTRELEESFGKKIPPYAILSHTWVENDEVSFQEMTMSAWPSQSQRTKGGWAKIESACDLTAKKNLEYIWIDTCCIDKSSSAELTESINSMYEWYKNSVVCFVYLNDYHEKSILGLRSCRWFTRGWTLQELLAPGTLDFYDLNWNRIGSREDLAGPISSITKIPTPIVSGLQHFRECSVAQRMAWAANRDTSRPEDRAYSLLGIFGIHMPMIYGEGDNAFRRLQDEIIQRNLDLTILAWTPKGTGGEVCSPLAPNPDAFKDCHDFRPSPLFEMPFSTCNKGLQVLQKRLFVHSTITAVPGGGGGGGGGGDVVGGGSVRYLFEVGRRSSGRPEKYVCIPVRKTGYATYVRETVPPLFFLSDEQKRDAVMTMVHDFFLATATITTTPRELLSSVPLPAPSISRPTRNTLPVAIHIFQNEQFVLRNTSPVPPTAYDHASGLCYFPLGIGMQFFACSYSARVGTQRVEFGLLLGSQSTRHPIKLVLVDLNEPEGRLLFLLLRRNPDRPMTWSDIHHYLPAVNVMGPTLVVVDGEQRYAVDVSQTERDVVLSSKTTTVRAIMLGSRLLSADETSLRLRSSATV